MSDRPARKLVPSEREFVGFVEASSAGSHMLDKVGKNQNTKIAYSKGCRFFSDFMKKGLDEIVAEYQQDVKSNAYEGFDKWERIFDDFAIYLEKTLHLGTSSVSVFHSGAKALINCNVPRSLRLQAKSPAVVSRTIQGCTLDEVKEIYSIVAVRERAIIAFLKDSGMSRADALILKIGDLQDFEKGEQFIHLQVYRGKEHVEYETFIGPNAVDALRAYFKWREKNGETLTKESPLFVTSKRPFRQLNENALNSIFLLMKKRTGKIISSHRLRKFFETRMACAHVNPATLKYWMGHSIRGRGNIESRYILPTTEEQLALYKEAYHEIDLTGGTLEERATQAAKAELAKMMTPEQKEIFTRAGYKFRRKETIDEAAKETCPDGKHCGEEDFKQISESQLLQYLRQGWQISYKLDGGQVIIKAPSP